jgi:hypothetical protein
MNGTDAVVIDISQATGPDVGMSSYANAAEVGGTCMSAAIERDRRRAHSAHAAELRIGSRSYQIARRRAPVAQTGGRVLRRPEWLARHSRMKPPH